MPYCTASAQHKDLADVAALEQSYEFCIAVWFQPASSTRRGGAPKPTILQPLPRGHGRHGGRLRLRQREGRGGRDLAHAGPLMRTTHAQGQRADSNHPPAQTRAPAGLLMQMFITYAPEQRADSNHPPARTSQPLAELEQPSCMLEPHAFSINGYSKNRNLYEIIPEDAPRQERQGGVAGR